MNEQEMLERFLRTDPRDVGCGEPAGPQEHQRTDDDAHQRNRGLGASKHGIGDVLRSRCRQVGQAGAGIGRRRALAGSGLQFDLRGRHGVTAAGRGGAMAILLSAVIRTIVIGRELPYTV